MEAMMSSPERKRLHPHKFTMWVGLGSIVMMFAGLTSAYMVRSAQANWLDYHLPSVFWYSTIIMVVSSITIHLALKNFKARQMSLYRFFMITTAILGLAFLVMQYIGFLKVEAGGLPLFGFGSNPSASFLGIIGGLHGLHVIGGVIAMIIMVARAYFGTTKQYGSTGIEIVSTYWHFVDALWIYLFIFFNWV